MSKKASNCQECKHHYFRGPVDSISCRKFHRPRFYTPRNIQDAHIEGKWGWKRVCEDFDPMSEFRG